ncbi:hypothetical protein [Phascolarctobacterium faecium]|uniref:hypothetical protein n=1 Tax=Phascolarctobacterium faecium TaxID=33025 RepID=UPI003AB80361
MELIDKEQTKKMLLDIDSHVKSHGVYLGTYFDGVKAGYQSAAACLDTLPVVEERKHGYWIEHPEHPVGDCSICGERVPIYSGSKKYKICPYCGAIMDGETND